jgi:hypothetical protein
MNKNSPELIKKKSLKKFPIIESKIIENIQPENHQSDIVDNSASKAYEMALFKKRIMWQATIFALKIVIPVVILSVILMKFLE